jgi:hypothetical protein
MRELHKTIVGVATAILVATGFGVSSAQQAPLPEPQQPEQAEPVIECPEAMRGMEVKAETVDGGVVLQITNSRTEHVTELRRELRVMADVIEQHSKTTNTAVHDPEAVRIPPVTITVRDVAAGVRVHIRADRPNDVMQLRELALGFQQTWEGSECGQGIVSQRA